MVKDTRSQMNSDSILLPQIPVSEKKGFWTLKILLKSQITAIKYFCRGICFPNGLAASEAHLQMEMILLFIVTALKRTALEDIRLILYAIEYITKARCVQNLFPPQSTET